MIRECLVASKGKCRKDATILISGPSSITCSASTLVTLRGRTVDEFCTTLLLRWKGAAGYEAVGSVYREFTPC